MDRFKKKILENMGNADMKMDDLGAEDVYKRQDDEYQSRLLVWWQRYRVFRRRFRWQEVYLS